MVSCIYEKVKPVMVKMQDFKIYFSVSYLHSKQGVTMKSS